MLKNILRTINKIYFKIVKDRQETLEHINETWNV